MLGRRQQGGSGGEVNKAAWKRGRKGGKTARNVGEEETKKKIVK